jgi:transcription initiation factor TFIIIB Brf1 subunit/transcription initiation factor TFIIB
LAIQCPECGTYNITAAEVCKKCGAAFKAKLSRIEPEKPEKKTGFFARLFGKK